MPASTAWWAMFWAIIVLPRPWAATSTTLRPSARKSRRRAASTAARSMRLGQAQSKSLIGVKRPRRLRARRRSRLRRVRSCCSRLDEMLEELGGAPAALGGEGDEIVEVGGGVVQAEGWRASASGAIGRLLAGRGGGVSRAS